MKPEASDKVKQIFGEVFEKPPAERAAFLAAACGGDAGLRGEVEALLAAFDDAAEFLISKDASAADAGGSPSAVLPARAGGSRDHKGFQAEDAEATVALANRIRPHEGPGTVIGRYKLLQEIGHGGFGTVFMAEQREPVKRRVALKIIKLGMDTKQVIARFEAERQALALMDHPNIARVLDAGATDSGRPFFVMELVKGITITEYCDSEKLDTQQRLELFIKVCNAVQHAHQKGIIHRDIKPSNVLVTLHDGVPVPKVIDFGIAKATNAELTEKTLFTEHHQMIGTPAYMSPEQAEMSGLDIDTRSDIYSLGVLLYELLTGTMPFDAARLLSAGYNEMLRILREEEPHKPSTRVGSVVRTAPPLIDEGSDGEPNAGSSIEHIAKHRQTDPKSLIKELRGDLDWIVMKCLEKDRSRRYDTANGLGMDIARHLSDEPVLAGPASAAYHARRLLYKHRRLVTAVVAVFFALSVGLVASTVLFFQAREASRKAIRTQRFLQDVLSLVNPYNREPKPTGYTVQELMSEAGRRAEMELANDAEVQAAILHTIGSTYLGLGIYPEAERYLQESLSVRRRILGEDHPDTLDSLKQFAWLRNQQGRYADAEALMQGAIRALDRVKGNEHEETLEARVRLAWIVARLGRYREAATLHKELLNTCTRTLGLDHATTLHALSNYAWVLCDLGEAAQAEEYLRQSMEGYRRVFGKEHLQTLRGVNNYARVLGLQGKFAEAAPYFESNLEA